MADDAFTVDEPAVALGLRIRKFRMLRRLSLRDLGAATQTSAGFLSQLERGSANASVSTLRRISGALELTVADLFDERLCNGSRLLRRADRPQLQAANGLEKYLITQRPLRHMEVYVCELAPGASTGDVPLAHGDSQEVLLVRGDVSVEIDGQQISMHHGDSIEYESSVPHRVINHGDAAVEVLWIVSPPSNDSAAVDGSTHITTSGEPA